jgi:hypothetical protein
MKYCFQLRFLVSKLCKVDYSENTKRNNEPIYDKNHVFFKFCVMSEIW